ncbi:MAG: hypothetical protein AAFR16_06955 [Pseudomonadota bacterium]
MGAVAAVSAALAAASAAAEVADPPPPIQRLAVDGVEAMRADAGATPRDRRALFIGNSFTYGANVPATAGALLRAAPGGDPRWRTAMIAIGGARLSETSRRRWVQAHLSATKPGVLVLQPHSLSALDAEGRAASSAGAAALANLAGGAQAPMRIVLFEPWPRAPGHPLYAQPGRPSAPAAMAARIRGFLDARARALGAELAPVGAAFLAAAAAAPETRLHHADRYHAGPAGAYLAAAVLARRIGGRSVAAAAHDGGLAPSLARRLRAQADAAVAAEDRAAAARAR